MAVAWPGEINQRVLASGYSDGPERNIIGFKPEIGPPKERRRSSVATDIVTWPSAYTKAEWLALKAWYRDDLKDGVLPFERVDPLSGSLDTFTFTDAPKIASVNGPYYFVDLQLRRMP